MVEETHAARAASPFARLRARGVLAVTTLFVVIAVSVALLTLRGRIDPFALGAVAYGAAAAALLWRGWRTGLRWRWVFGPAPRLGDLPLTLGLVPVAVFTLAATLLVFVPLSYLAPDFVSGHLLSQQVFSVRTLRAWCSLFVVGVVLAPVVEETLFRGILMQRWAYKWGTRTGVIASSVLFAVGHGEWLGHFAFGLVLCAIYLRTRRLWVGIIAHALNNFVVVASLLPNALAGRSEASETLVHFRAQLWNVLPLLLVAGVLGWAYLRWLWPAAAMQTVIAGPVPYDAAAAAETQEMSALGVT